MQTKDWSVLGDKPKIYGQQSVCLNCKKNNISKFCETSIVCPSFVVHLDKTQGVSHLLGYTFSYNKVIKCSIQTKLFKIFFHYISLFPIELNGFLPICLKFSRCFHFVKRGHLSLRTSKTFLFPKFVGLYSNESPFPTITKLHLRF